MRIIRELSYHQCRITFFHWNNRYLIKLEQGFLEQTFKINEFDLTGEADLLKLVDDHFLKEAMHRFQEMNLSLEAASHRLGH